MKQIAVAMAERRQAELHGVNGAARLLPRVLERGGEI
jgi:hypothetical protein